ncbi:MAG TPA: hypothetical protein VK559_03635 [Ferruginibacter sp.]|nr:hypothetical protein [Ferruginibacter sp.]
MERIRKPFQGVINIVRFNWHFYALSFSIVLLLLFITRYTPAASLFYILLVCIAIVVTTFISLLVSFFIYDLSNLYTLDWLDRSGIQPANNIININAGFDETSALLQLKYPAANMQVFDFYDERKHTEVSIKRARAAYPPYKNTIYIDTSTLPLADSSIDTAFLLLAAHEIRNDRERIAFFEELKRVIVISGRIIVTEHLRDMANFLAYTMGAFHFHSKPTWLKTFTASGFVISKEIKVTPFITTFILEKNGTTA